MTELEDNINNTVEFVGEAGTGFKTCKCLVCNDTKVRAGFSFDDNSIVYNCFRGKCPVGSAVYKNGDYMSKKFRDVMDAFGITIPTKSLIRNKTIKREILDDNLFEKHKYEPVVLPKELKPYDPNRDRKFLLYLQNRGIDDTDYYVHDHGKFYNKLVVPFRFKNFIIGWQTIDITGKYNPYKYGNDNMLFFPDGKIPQEPLIVEGVFDAKSIPNGIGTLQSTISKKQAYLIRNTKPIFVPDRKGSRYLEDAKRYGWRISIPDWKEKDPNAALEKYGKLVVAQMIYDGIMNSYAKAQMKYELWRIK